jgi:hypothetical protein
MASEKPPPEAFPTEAKIQVRRHMHPRVHPGPTQRNAAA